MTHHTDPDTIERQLERERASLASTLDELSGRVSPEGMAREAFGTLRENAAVYTRTIDEAVRSNPLALALTGVGIAWLVFGSKTSQRNGHYHGDGHLHHDGHQHRDGQHHAHGHGDWHSGQAQGYGAHSQHDESWTREADSLRERAVATLHRIEEEARHYYNDVREGLVDRYSQARDFAAERSAVVADLTSDIRRKLSEGLDDLSEGAREQVVAARERAYTARLRAGRMGKRMVTEPTRLIEENPIAAGAVAVALGAALGAALPRTRTEDRYFGAESDRLMGEAADLLRSERQRAMRVAQGIGEELREVATEAADELAGKAGEAADRVKNRAKAEVDVSATEGR